MWILLLLVFKLVCCNNQYEIQWVSLKDVQDKTDADYEKITLSTELTESYTCLIPSSDSVSNNIDSLQEKLSDYNGPSPLHLLDSLFLSEKCDKLVDVYWIYTLCHGKSISQSHKPSLNFILGKLEGFWQSEQFKDDHLNPDFVILPGSGPEIRLPYLPIKMTDGTACDVGVGLPRTTIVKYMCNPNLELSENRGELITVREISTCQYEALVLTPHLCSHPAYLPPPNGATKLFCGSNQIDSQKPRALRLLEENHKAPVQYYKVLFPDSAIFDSGLHKLHGDVNNEDDEDDINTAAFKGRASVDRPSDMSDAQHRTLSWFLSGTTCLKGGTGWWHYEFCYGDKLRHIHEERVRVVGGGFSNEIKQIIVLGVWNVEAHKKWALKNKRSEKADTLILYYGGGDICHEINEYRFTLVHLKCIPADSSTTRVSGFGISLTETSLCQYDLVVESHLLCPVIAAANEFGIPDISSFI